MPRITAEQFHTCISELEEEPRDPRVGFFGPGSAAWKYGREAIVMLGAGRAALMQAAHPQVAWAVTSHSAVMADVAGRFRRTFENVFAMGFGGRDEALRRARLVRRIHGRVNGTIGENVGRYREGDRFDALDRDATFWVAATLWDTEILINDILNGPVPPSEKERFYRESLRFAQLFGISPDEAPANWWAFRRWVDDMVASDEIAVGEAAREICQHIVSPPRRAAAPAYRWLRGFTASILPPKLADGYGMQPGVRDRMLTAASCGVLRQILPWLPEQLRYFPGYLDARRRFAGQPGRDPVGEWLERMVLAGMSPAGE